LRVAHAQLVDGALALGWQQQGEPGNTVEFVAARMAAALIKGGFNVHGLAMNVRY
jgi:hypothetical protein